MKTPGLSCCIGVTLLLVPLAAVAQIPVGTAITYHGQLQQGGGLDPSAGGHYAAIDPAYVAGLTAQRNTLLVPGDYTTIQAAIDAAAPGDIVEIADGTYTGPGNKDLDFGGKAITVRSASGDPALCIIDCEASGRGFYFHSDEGADSIVEGLTITNAWEYTGGGVQCIIHSSPTLTNCIITANGVYSVGGGVGCWHGSNPTLTDCTITGNATSSFGGGVYCDGSSPTLINCTISGNQAQSSSIHAGGGGIYCDDGSNPTLTNCTISGNQADWYGGGIHSINSNPTLVNCTITGGTANYGGGVHSDDSSPTLINCTISGNTAVYNGGGVYCDGVYSGGSGPTLTNCIINENAAGWHGGGVDCVGSAPTLTNCTITACTAGNDGGGVSSWHGSSPTLTNCILWGDSPDEITLHQQGSVTLAYSSIQGGWTGTGNIDADPLFAGLNDFHLAAGSPCIDAGDNAAVPPDLCDLDGDGDLNEPLPFDLDGNLRFFDDPATDDTGSGTPPLVDMGAYELAGPVSCPGDSNCDGQVNWRDVDFFVAAQNDNVSAWIALHEQVYGAAPSCPFANNDVDGSGVANWRDVDPFVALQNTTCP